MPTPKSVTKISTKGVTYTSNVDKAQYYIHELSRGAMRDVGKFVRKRWQESYYSHFKKHSGDGGKATSYKVLASKNTLYPRVEIGLEHSKKGKAVKGFYAYFQEFGSSRVPRLGLLQKTVNDNIAEIIKIESQYLSALEGEASRLESLINEEEMGDEDE